MTTNEKLVAENASPRRDIQSTAFYCEKQLDNLATSFEEAKRTLAAVQEQRCLDGRHNTAAQAEINVKLEEAIAASERKAEIIWQVGNVAQTGQVGI